MSYWDIELRRGRSALTLNNVGVTIPFTEETVPVIDSTDIDITNLRKSSSSIPQGYNLSEHGPWVWSVKKSHTDG